MGFMYKIELTELADGLDVECERKESIKDELKLSQSALVNDRVTFRDGEDHSIEGFGGTMGNQEFKFVYINFGSCVKHPGG